MSGKWSSAFNWPLIGLESAITPDGEVLSYGTDADGTQTGLHIYDVWNPATNAHDTLQNTTHTDEFCSAAAIIPGTDELLLTGGDARPIGAVNSGVPDSNIYDASTKLLTPNPSGGMAFARWYPTMITLDTGQLLVLGGRDLQNHYVGYPEIFTPGYGWRTLTGAYIADYNVVADYPRTWEASDGKVITFAAHGVASNVYAIDTSGNGSVSVVGQLPAAISWYQPAIMYAVDKVLVHADDGTCWIMDMSGPNVTFSQTASLGTNFDWSNMLVLPNGDVLVTGGSGVANQLTNVNYTAEIWDPKTGQWTADANASIARLYHSDTNLLPDGTVLSLGGGAPGPLVNTNGEIYTPSYLLDANGQPAIRPVIQTAPSELDVGQTFTIKVDNPASITDLALMPFGFVTHSVNMTARRVDLPFTVQADGTLKMTLPSNSAVLTPGYWMLFAINSNGTPSLASTIQIQTDNPYHLTATPKLNLDALSMVNAGSATYEGYDDAYSLTPNDKFISGAEWSSRRLDLSQKFSIGFETNLGSVGGLADGITFLLQNDPAGIAALGGTGGTLGAYGIAKSFGIEFDTYDNSDYPNEIAQPHTNFITTDPTNADWSVSAATAVPTIVDGNWHKVVVQSDGTNLSYSLDGTTIATATVAAVEGYVGSQKYAYFGFTGATGGASGQQLVRLDSVSGSLEGGANVTIDRSTLPKPENFAVNGNATLNSALSTWTLTTAQKWQHGSVMSADRIDLRQAFNMTFKINLGSDPNGADGMAFVLQNDPAGTAALAGTGGTLGAAGIKNGVGIAFDTYQNTEIFQQIAQDHTNFFDTSNTTSDPDLTPETSVNNGDLKDGLWHTVSVSSNGNVLSYTVDGRPMASLDFATLEKYLGGSRYAYFGVTGATGGGTELQRLQVLSLNATAENGSQLHIDGYDTAPIENNDAYSVTENGVLTVDAAHGVLANDSDPVGNPIFVTTNSRVASPTPLLQPGHGTVTMNADGSFTYKPTAGFAGLDTFNYSVDDAYSGAIGTVTINVGASGGSTISVKGPLSDTVAVGGAAVTRDLLTGASDSNGDPMMVSGLTGLSAGVTLGPDGHTLSIDPGNTAFQTLTNGVQQTIALNYNITDSAGSSTQQSETVAVVGLDHQPNFVFNGYAADQGELGGTSTYDMTQKAKFESGSMMSATRLDLTKAFDISFAFNFGNDPNAADGLAFVLQNDPAGSKALGGTGGNLGAAGIKNGVGIVFDIYQNTEVYTQIAQDHTNIIDTSNQISNPDITPETPVGNGNLKDGNWHDVQVHWDGQNLNYSVDGVAEAGLTIAQLAKYLAGSNDAYFGFTGATGGGVTTNSIRLDSLSSTDETGKPFNIVTHNANDIYQFNQNFGQQDLTNFQAGTATAHDTLDLHGLGFASFNDVLAHTDGGINAVIHAGSSSITLTGVSAAQLHPFNILV